MAEFTDVMRQAKRMCAVNGGMCGARNCPLDNGETCRLLPDYDGEDYNELERIIMDWAAEHPEPVYPSWEEGWRQLFPDADIRRTLCPEVFGDKYKCDWCHDDNDNCDECLERPMPAEVAEKLGIKPIAPGKPAPEHDGCDGCKWYDKKEKDEPCVNCRGTLIGGDEKPDLWEAADNGQ